MAARGPLAELGELGALDRRAVEHAALVCSPEFVRRRTAQDVEWSLRADGLAAARAGGAVSGRRPRVAQLGVLDDVRQSFRDGASIAALARDHHVSRVAVRTAIADLPPAITAEPHDDGGVARGIEGADDQVPARIEMPGTLVQRLHDLAEHRHLGEAEQRALRDGRTVRRGQGDSLQITAAPHTHHALPDALTDLDGRDTGPAERKAYRIYRDRVRQQHQHAETPRRS